MSGPAACKHGVEVGCHCALCLRDRQQERDRLAADTDPQQFAQDDDCDGDCGCDNDNIPSRIDVACRVLQLHCGSESDSVTGAGRVSSELVEVAEKAIREFIEGKS